MYDLRNLKLGYAAAMDVMEQRARHLHQEFDASDHGVERIKNDPYGNHQKATRYLMLQQP